MKDLAWKPQATMADAIKYIFNAYRGQVVEARKLMDYWGSRGLPRVYGSPA